MGEIFLRHGLVIKKLAEIVPGNFGNLRIQWRHAFEFGGAPAQQQNPAEN
jgi:hypothetical protein